MNLRLLWNVTLLFALAAFASAETEKQLATRIVDAARSQIGVTVGYDPAYRTISYPNGDVPKNTGVCSDVVVRALRTTGIDLQKEVHEDMLKAFEAYPKKWGLKRPDSNIDHRRVPNLMCYFARKHIRMDEKLDVAMTYRGGDIVAWDLGGGITHIGIVSDRRTASAPLIIHNIGNGAREEDVLFKYKIIGHYRIKTQG
ncbi:MAG: DUF1287 domain-containing protein [Nibricoccus sp.]